MFGDLFKKLFKRDEKLPYFRYHPDPIATGYIVQSRNKCACCRKKRGYIYTGPYSLGDVEVDDDFDFDDFDEKYEDALCPWCIASGKANKKFNVIFTDPLAVQSSTELDQKIINEISSKTPGFCGWQQENWLCHCKDGAAFLGVAGKKELEAKWPSLIEDLKLSTGLQGKAWDDFFKALNIKNGPTAYVFQCLHCSELDCYTDCT